MWFQRKGSYKISYKLTFPAPPYFSSSLSLSLLLLLSSTASLIFWIRPPLLRSPLLLCLPWHWAVCQWVWWVPVWLWHWLVWPWPKKVELAISDILWPMPEDWFWCPCWGQGQQVFSTGFWHWSEAIAMDKRIKQSLTWLLGGNLAMLECVYIGMEWMGFLQFHIKRWIRFLSMLSTVAPFASLRRKKKAHDLPFNHNHGDSIFFCFFRSNRFVIGALWNVSVVTGLFFFKFFH